MPHENSAHTWRIAPLIASLLCAVAILPALATDAAPAPGSAPLSESVAINLINRLVKRGALTQEDADELIKLAEADAAAARAQAAAGQPAAVAAPQAAAAPVSDDTVRVTYVPEVVKAQIREEIKQDVIAEAKKENWVAPNSVPDWVSRFTFFGDFRFRYEGDFYPSGNNITGAFPNFNAINTGAPFDVSGTIFSPQYDVDQDRNRFRIRARLGAALNEGDGFTAGIRFGTGENDSPVTENQSLGAANGVQGGDFAKYSLWLDRAFLKYEVGGLPDDNLSITVGRFDNPFFGTVMTWADDLGFDGAVLKEKHEIAKGLTPFLTVGAFPVFDTDLNFATNQPAKFASEDKWLYAAQIGATWTVNSDVTAKVGGAYYYFQNIEGKLSTPFTPLTTSDSGDTDDSRPSFAQNGNTYMALRDIVPTALNDFGTIDQYQYFGLAAPFHELELTASLDYTHFEPFTVTLTAEYENNLAFNRGAIAAIAVNNLGPATTTGGTGAYIGGNAAWIVSLKVGNATLEKRWDWNSALSYRHVESDSLVDGFVDSDFGATLLGTNLKGYTLINNLALTPRVWVAVRWMSATAIAGPVYKNDLIQMDINTKF